MRSKPRLAAFVTAAAAALPSVAGGGGSAVSAAPGGAWLATQEAAHGVDNLSAFPNGVYYALFRDSYVRSKDYGLTWERMTPPPDGQVFKTSGLRTVRFATPTVGYAMVGGASYPPTRETCRQVTPLRRTTDGGTTWQPICLPETPTPDRTVFEPAASNRLSLWRDGRTFALYGVDELKRRPAECHPPVATVYTTRDAGGHWTRAVLPRNYYPGMRHHFLDATTAVMIAYKMKWDDRCGGDGSRNAVFVTTDGGRSYRKVLDCLPSPICSAARYVTKKRLVVGRVDGSTLVSDNGGKTWRPGQDLSYTNAAKRVMDVREGSWVQDFSFADSRHGFASTRGGGTWRTSDGGRTWVQERSHECDYLPFGIGEIAAATKDHAITGGPKWISSRHPVAQPVGGCEASPQQLPDLSRPVVEWTVAGATTAVWPDGVLTVR